MHGWKNVGRAPSPAAFDLDFRHFQQPTQHPRIHFKSDGQECPPHTLSSELNQPETRIWIWVLYALARLTFGRRPRP